MKLYIVNTKKILKGMLLIFIIILFLSMIMKISRNTFGYYDPLYKGNENSMKVAFACNVVWGNEYLEEIMKILNDNGIKITFFAGGIWANNNKNLLTQLHENQHEIGSHGYRHIKYTTLNSSQVKEDILKSEQAIESILGYKPKLLSPPYGDINERVSKVAEELGYTVIMWSIDTIDWNTKDYNKILARIKNKHHPGAIILMHPTESTVKALPDMIQTLHEKGYKIVTVSEIKD